MLVSIGIIDEWGVLEMFASFRFNKSFYEENKKEIEIQIKNILGAFGINIICPILLYLSSLVAK